MAITGKLYYPFLVHALTGGANLTTDNLRVQLHTSSYTPNQTHAHLSDTSAEISGTGYTTGGMTIASATVYNSTGTIIFDGADNSWTTATVAAAQAVIYDRVGADSTVWPLIGYVDFGGTQSASSGTFTIQWSTAGIATITVS